MLLERDGVDPDKPDNDGKTPLTCSAWNGHVDVVKILLERDDIHPDKPAPTGGTPLSYAALKGHVGVARMLLEREVNPDRANIDGRTPLLCAACNGHTEVVKILLERDEVSPDKPDNDGRTPLSYAAGNGYPGVVEILLGREWSTLANQMILAKHHSGWLLGTVTQTYWPSYSPGATRCDFKFLSCSLFFSGSTCRVSYRACGYRGMQICSFMDMWICGSDMCGLRVSGFVAFSDQAPSTFLFSHPISRGIGY